MQVVDEVPAAPHDATVDALVTEEEALYFGRTQDAP
jgi:5-formyltetrahydrofolate cyclo-ligase